MFKKGDTDGNGFMDESEFMVLHGMLHEVGYIDEDASTWRHQLDPEGTGKIFLNSYIQWVIKHGYLDLHGKVTPR